jgi:hypothetical protein
MRPKIRLVLVAVALLLGCALAAYSDCYSYSNSSPQDFGLPYGAECAGTGPGCTQCVTYQTPPYQSEVCVYYDIWDVFCVTFGPDIRN